MLHEILKDVVGNMCNKVSDSKSGTLAQGRACVAQEGKQRCGSLILKVGGRQDAAESEQNLAQDI